ncbi:unnamed protein product [Effrenium voratum]|nr:unnamed protein product [Effrenium voratum]
METVCLERQRLERAVGSLRRDLEEGAQRSVEQCALVAKEEATLLRAKWASERRQVAEESRAAAELVASACSALQTREEELRRAEVEAHREEAQSLWKARAAEAEARKEAAAQELQRRRAERQRDEEQLTQKLRWTEEACAKNEGDESMTLQEQLAADLKTQLKASQEKVAGLESSVESMGALVLQKEAKLKEMLRSCEDLHCRASEKDLQDRFASELTEGERCIGSATREMRRLADVDAAAPMDALRNSGAMIAEVAAAAAALSEAPEALWVEETKRLQEAGHKKRMAVPSSSGELQAQELRLRLAKLTSKDTVATKEAAHLQAALDAKSRRLLLLTAALQDAPSLSRH